MRRPRPRSSAMVRFIRRWRIPFALATVALQTGAVVLVVVVFPDVSNLWEIGRAHV